MYEAHFGLNERPFALRPDPEFLFLSQTHREAVSMLEYAFLGQPGVAVMCGPSGVGKTLLVRKLLEVDHPSLTVGLVNNTYIDSFEELLQWVLFSFGLEYQSGCKVELFQTLVEFLIEEAAQERRVILLIDDAQHLSDELLEQTRQLTNLNVDKDDLLQLIFLADDSLAARLKAPSMQNFSQCVAVDCRLQRLDEQDVPNYIAHRLAVAGGDERLFDEACYPLIYTATAGVPRHINLLCDTALTFAFAEQNEQVSVDIIEEVVRSRANSMNAFLPITKHLSQ